MLVDIIRILELARPIAKAIPGIGNTLEGSVETIMQLARAAEASKRLRHDWLDLAKHAADIFATVIITLHTNRTTDKFIQMSIAAGSLVNTLSECHSLAIRESSTRGLRALWNLDRTRAQLGACRHKLDEAVTTFNIQSHVTNSIILDDLRSRLASMSSELSAMHGETRAELAIIKQNVQNPFFHDGNYRLYLLSELKVIKTLSAPSAIVEVHEAVDLRTEKTCVIRRCCRTEQHIFEHLEALKRRMHANSERLLGYSSPSSGGDPFYVFEGGNQPWLPLWEISDAKAKEMLTTSRDTKHKELNAALQFLESLPGIDRTWRPPTWRWGLFEVWLSHKNKPIVLDIHIASDNTLILPLPIEDSTTRHHTDVSDRDLKPLDWLDARDTWNLLFTAKFPSCGYQPPWGSFFLMTSTFDAHTSIPWVGESATYSTDYEGECVHGDVYEEVSQEGSQFRLKHWQLGSKFELITWHSIADNTWRDLVNMHSVLALQHDVKPSEVCAVESVAQYTTIWETTTDILHNHSPEEHETLTFVLAPSNTFGPQHVASGHLSFGPDEAALSSITLCEWDTMKSKWVLHLSLLGRQFVMEVTMTVHYAQFTERDLRALEHAADGPDR